MATQPFLSPLNIMPVMQHSGLGTLSDDRCSIYLFLMLKGWGTPTAIMQLSHLSSSWALADLYWVDERGFLVFRKQLRMGDRHCELTSADHVWLLNVVRHENSDYPSSSSGTHKSDGSSVEQFSFIFQPCVTALRRSKMTTVVWIPRKSITLSQRDVTPSIPSHKLKNTDDDSPEPPVFQIQLL